jgi:hypothetical protein
MVMIMLMVKSVTTIVKTLKTDYRILILGVVGPYHYYPLYHITLTGCLKALTGDLKFSFNVMDAAFSISCVL